MFPGEDFDPLMDRPSNRRDPRELRREKPLGALVERALWYAQKFGQLQGELEMQRQANRDLHNRNEELQKEVENANYYRRNAEAKRDELIEANDKLETKLEAAKPKRKVTKRRKKV